MSTFTLLVLFMLGLILVLIIIAIILFNVAKKIKLLKLDNVVLINGGVKSGKTTLAVALAIRSYRKALILWWFKLFLNKCLNHHKIRALR